MPIYKYQCHGCGQVSEVLQKMSDKPIKKCPECGGQVSKLMSMNSFHLKGSGWYVTDYSGKKSDCVTKTDKPETKTADTAEKKADAPKTTETPSTPTV